MVFSGKTYKIPKKHKVNTKKLKPGLVGLEMERACSYFGAS